MIPTRRIYDGGEGRYTIFYGLLREALAIKDGPGPEAVWVVLDEKRIVAPRVEFADLPHHIRQLILNWEIDFS